MPNVDDYQPGPLLDMGLEELEIRILAKTGEITRVEQHLRDLRQELNTAQRRFRELQAND